MKILLVNKFHFQKGGAETYYFTLAEALKKAGHEVIFFSMRHKKNIPCDQEKYFVENREYVSNTSLMKKIKAAKNIVYSKEAYDKMQQLIKDEKPDLAILNNIHRQLTTSIVDALYENNIKIYWVVHDLIMLCPNYQMLDGNGEICEDCCKGKYSNCIKKKCVKNSKLKSYLAYREAKYNRKHNTYDRIDRFITPSLFYKNKLIEYGFNNEKVHYIPNPLGFSFKFELCDTFDDYLLYFGRLSREKGIKTLIDAISNFNYKLVVIGTGPLENELIEYSKGSNNIQFLGFKTGDELSDFIKNSKFVVLPSEWYENGPYSAMEALGFGKPLIVSNNGGLPELVKDNVNGFIYSSNSDLVEKIDRVIKMSSDEYINFSKEAYKLANEKFNPIIYVDRLFGE